MHACSYEYLTKDRDQFFGNFFFKLGYIRRTCTERSDYRVARNRTRHDRSVQCMYTVHHVTDNINNISKNKSGSTRPTAKRKTFQNLREILLGGRVQYLYI